MPLYRLGNVHDCPSLEMLSAAPARRMFQERQERNAQECGDCAHFDFWRGGCPYNVLAANTGHQRYNVCGAYCVHTYEHVFLLTEENIDQAKLVELLPLSPRQNLHRMHRDPGGAAQ
jgi:radical SAM protein with 4Fe4S-binding SPASM domain